MAYKLFSTGEVLTAANVNNYLMNQTVMVFASAAARTTALSGVLAEGMISYRTDSQILEYYNGSAWTAVGSTIPTSYGFTAGKNKIINGDFFINQRNFTSNTTTGTYNFDRFLQANSGGTCTITPQTFTPGTAPVSGYEAKNFVQIVTASQSAAGDYGSIGQRIEDVRTLAGQTATISFWAKATSGTPKISNSIQQNFGTGGSPSSTVITKLTGFTLSTSWARYSVTVAVPSISGKTIGSNNDSGLWLDFWTSAGTGITAYSDIGIQNTTIQIWGVQVEAGSVATAFQTATGTVQGELAACQRYYWRFGGSSTNQRFGNGIAYSATAVFIEIVPPVPMRVSPTAIEYSTLMVFNATQTLTPSAIALNNASPFVTELLATTVGATVNSPFIMSANSSTSAYLAFTAEL
jgi:hypothetical protein